MEAFEKNQDLTNTTKSVKKSEKTNSSKNQFKSKYALHKIVRRVPFYAATAFKSTSLKWIVEAKALVKKTIKSFRDIDLDLHKAFTDDQEDLGEIKDQYMKDNKSCPLLPEEASFYRKSMKPEHIVHGALRSRRKGFHNDELTNFCKLYRKNRGSLYSTGRLPYDRYFSDVRNNRLNFEYRKHSGIRILLRGDLLGALNCFFPQLHLVPSEANAKKPILSEDFSNYSHTYQELEESFALARKYRKELFQPENNCHLNNFCKEKQAFENSVRNFVTRLERRDFDHKIKRDFLYLRNNQNTTNAREMKDLLEACPASYELKAARANTSLKPVNFKDMSISVDHSQSNIPAREESSAQLDCCSKSEPQLNKKISNKEILKSICLHSKNPIEFDTPTNTEFSMSKVSVTTCPDISLSEKSPINNEDTYPDRLEDLHLLELVVDEINALIDKNSPSKPFIDNGAPGRCTYSSVLKNSVIPDQKTIFTSCFEDKGEACLFNGSIKDKIGANASENSGNIKIPRAKVVYNDREIERNLVDNIERILEDDPKKLAIPSPVPAQFQRAQSSVYKESNKIVANFSRDFSRGRVSQPKLDQHHATSKRQLTSQILQTPPAAAVNSGFISPKRVPTLYEVEAFNKFIQQNFHTQNVNSINQNFGNILNKISVPQQSPSMYSSVPQYSAGSQMNAIEHGNKCELQNSQHFHGLQNQGPTTAQVSSGFYSQLNKELMQSSMAANNSKIDVRTIISASDLEKQAIEQYRQSEESLSSRYDVLEREAEEQYNNFNGHK